MPAVRSSQTQWEKIKWPECRNCRPVVCSGQALTWLSLSLWLQRGKEALQLYSSLSADLENPPARFAWLHSLLVNLAAGWAGGERERESSRASLGCSPHCATHLPT